MDWDTYIFYSLNGLAGHWPWLDQSMRLISRPWTYVLPILLAFAFWFWKERSRALVLALVLGALIPLADKGASVVKELVARPRPCQILKDVTRVTGCGKAYGFPSNHAVNTAAAALFFHLLYPQTAAVVWPFVALIGFNRVYVGAHYPTDVLGGWLLGVIAAWVVVRLGRVPERAQKLFARFSKRA